MVANVSIFGLDPAGATVSSQVFPLGLIPVHMMSPDGTAGVVGTVGVMIGAVTGPLARNLYTPLAALAELTSLVQTWESHLPACIGMLPGIPTNFGV